MAESKKIFNVIFISIDGLTDPLGQSQILPYVQGLSEQGYRFTILSWEKKNRLAKHRAAIELVCKAYSIEWVCLTYRRFPPLLATVWNILRTRKLMKKLHQKRQFTIVHCRSYIPALIGIHLKYAYNVKFIFDMRGFWADERVEGGLWNLKNPIFKFIYEFFKRKEKQFVSEADHVISLTHHGKHELQSWKISQAPITVIPTCVDLKLFDPTRITTREQDLLRTKLGLGENDFILLYLGSWGTWYLTEQMLAFFSELKQHEKQAKFLIISQDKIDLSGFAHYRDVVVVAAQRKDVPGYISLARLSVCFIKPTFSKKASSATKMGETLAMNVPVITNAGWGDVSLFEHKMQITVVELTVEGYRDGYRRYDRTFRIPKEELHYLSLTNGVHSYLSVYNKLSSSINYE